MKFFVRYYGNTEQRKELLGRFITELGADKIDCLLADREFIGEDWFNLFGFNSSQLAAT